MSKQHHQPTVRELLQWADTILTQAEVPSAAANARALMEHVTGCSAAQLLLRDNLTEAEEEALRQAVARRAQREPLQHIMGTAPFMDFAVKVGPGVFIPRPETEQLADWVIRELTPRDAAAPQPLRILDICAGSGVLSIALSRGFPTARVQAVELSEQALPYLSQNVHELAPSVEIIHADATQNLVARGFIAPHSVDVVVCNPPYVPEESKRTGAVDIETLQYDPDQAVFSGEQGTNFTAALCQHLADYLAPGALIAMEHDDSTGHSTSKLLASAGLSTIEQHYDLTGRPRFLSALWTP